MLIVGSALKGYAIAATDGTIGSVRDCLFDDRTWKVRWLVIDTGGWLSGRQVLIHPSAVRHVGVNREMLFVDLTKAKIEASPGITFDEPVSQTMEESLYDYYGWNSIWGGAGYFDGYPLPAYREASALDSPGSPRAIGLGGHDPNLRSMAAVTGYDMQAMDGPIGHVENFVVDDETWNICYLIVDTRNWWFGKHVIVSPFAVTGINWSERQIRIDLSKDKIKGSPAWNPLERMDESDQRNLHSYYGWPGYGW